MWLVYGSMSSQSAVRAHEALGRLEALPGFLVVVHHLFEDGVFVGHDRSIRVDILRSPDCFALSREHADWELLRKRTPEGQMA
jgi:hypothetical protein